MICVQIDPTGFNAALGAANQLAAGVTRRNAWGVETILTTILVFVVFAATDSERATKTAHLPVRTLPTSQSAVLPGYLNLLPPCLAQALSLLRQGLASRGTALVSSCK